MYYYSIDNKFYRLIVNYVRKHLYQLQPTVECLQQGDIAM